MGLNEFYDRYSKNIMYRRFYVQRIHNVWKILWVLLWILFKNIMYRRYQG